MAAVLDLLRKRLNSPRTSMFFKVSSSSQLDLRSKSIGAFKQLDGGVHDVASKLVAASDVLMQSLNVHQIVNQSKDQESTRD